MPGTVHQLRPRLADSEKITINLGFVDLGRIDLLVADGFYANRTDLIRTAIRNQLDRHAEAVTGSVARQRLDLGLRHYSRADLEAARDDGRAARHPRSGPRQHRRGRDPGAGCQPPSLRSPCWVRCTPARPSRPPWPTAPADRGTPTLPDWTCTHERHAPGRHGRGHPAHPRRPPERGHRPPAAPAARRGHGRSRRPPRAAARAGHPPPADGRPAWARARRARAASRRRPRGSSSPRATPTPPARRAYKLYVPASAGSAGTRPLPLVVMLHGCTQSPDDFAAGTRMNQLAEEHGCYVAYPGQDRQGQRPALLELVPARRPGARPGRALADRRHRARRSCTEHRVDPTRVYVAGLSAGGAQAAIMAAAYPDLFAAVGVHSGLACGAARDLPSALAAMKQGPSGAAPIAPGPTVPTIVFHGDQDRTVNPLNGDRVAAQALAATAGLRTELEQGRSAGGLDYSRTSLCRPDRPRPARALDRPRRRPRLVRRQPRRHLHRPARPGCLARDARASSSPTARPTLEVRMSGRGSHEAHRR